MEQATKRVLDFLYVSCKACWTTRTCSSCGHVRDPFKGEVFHCTVCPLVVNRDLNTAKNYYHQVNTHKHQKPR
jgi:transposase